MQISFILGLSGLKKLLSHEIQNRQKIVVTTAVNLRCHQSLSAAYPPNPHSRSGLIQWQRHSIVLENQYLWFVLHYPEFLHCLCGQISTSKGEAHSHLHFCHSNHLKQTVMQSTEITSPRHSSSCDWLHPVCRFKMSWPNGKFFFFELFLRKRSHSSQFWVWGGWVEDLRLISGKIKQQEVALKMSRRDES